MHVMLQYTHLRCISVEKGKGGLVCLAVLSQFLCYLLNGLGGGGEGNTSEVNSSLDSLWGMGAFCSRTDAMQSILGSFFVDFYSPNAYSTYITMVTVFSRPDSPIRTWLPW